MDEKRRRDSGLQIKIDFFQESRLRRRKAHGWDILDTRQSAQRRDQTWKGSSRPRWTSASSRCMAVTIIRTTVSTWMGASKTKMSDRFSGS